MKACLLQKVLIAPETAIALSATEWDLLIRQARHAFLLARLSYLIDKVGITEQLSEAVQRHLLSGKVLSNKQKTAVKWETECIKKALVTTNIKPVFLKGGAYVYQDLPPMHGRIFSDVDIMVRKKDLELAERALILNGWIRKALTKYDQTYYREWMHELPPLISRKRQTVLDLHHTILPPTARITVNTEKLFENARECDGAYILAPIDMVLHSATHLFCDGELEHGMRDLVDLDALFRHFGQQETGFWRNLIERAGEVGLTLPLFYAVHFSKRLLETPIPDDVVNKLPVMSPLKKKGMDFLLSRALLPDHVSCEDRFTDLARWVLYVRSHYLRMPFYLLVPHLIRKAWKRRFDSEKDTAQ